MNEEALTHWGAVAPNKKSWLIYLSRMMTHGLTNFKFKKVKITVGFYEDFFIKI